jgi:hypothetical protein
LYHPISKEARERSGPSRRRAPMDDGAAPLAHSVEQPIACKQ